MNIFNGIVVFILIVFPIGVWAYTVFTWRQAPHHSPPALDDERR